MNIFAKLFQVFTHGLQGMQHHAVEQPRDRNKRDCERACQLGDFKEVHAQLLQIPRLCTLRRRAKMRNARYPASALRSPRRYGSREPSSPLGVELVARDGWFVPDPVQVIPGRDGSWPATDASAAVRLTPWSGRAPPGPDRARASSAGPSNGRSTDTSADGGVPSTCSHTRPVTSTARRSRCVMRSLGTRRGSRSPRVTPRS